MIKKVVPVALLAAVCGLAACNKGYKTTKDGLEYRIVKDVKEGKSPQIGDVVEMHIKTHVGDSVLFDSRALNNNEPIQFQLMPAEFKGDVTDGVLLMTPGDSAIFRIPVDSVKKMFADMPSWMKDGDKLEYNMVLVKIVKSKADLETEMKQQQEQQTAIDEELLQKHFQEKGITKAQRTPSGLYYVIHQPGSGEQPRAGQNVTLNYTGRTLDGNPFDSNEDPKFNHVEPFTFMLGRGQVIPGWDEGVALLKKGAKATFYIPSTLAYGPQSPAPSIPPNSVLVFDVTLTDVK